MLVNHVMIYGGKIGIFGVPTKGINLIIPLRTSYLLIGKYFGQFYTNAIYLVAVSN